MIIGLCGYAQSGKDTVAKILVEQRGFKRLAFADKLKECVLKLDPMIVYNHDNDNYITLQEIVSLDGWDEAKKIPEVRRLLQVFGTEVGRELLGQDVWVDQLGREIAKLDYRLEADEIQPNIVITDCRFHNELRFIRSHSGGKLWWIERLGFGPLNQHASENSLSSTLADQIISNNSTLEELTSLVLRSI